MLLHKLKLTAMSLLLLAAVATGAGWLAHSLAMKDEPVKEPAASVTRVAPREADSDQATTKPDPAAAGRMTVAGRVLDPDGKPVKGAVVDLVTRPRSPRVGASDEIDRARPAGPGPVRRRGRFQLDSPRTASTRVFEVHRAGRRAGIRPRLGRAESRRRAARGRDPAPARAGRPRPAGRRDRRAGQGRRGAASRASGGRTTRARSDGVSLGTSPPEGIRAWPRPVKTDDQGRIALPGIGRGVSVGLGVRDLRYARQDSTSIQPRLPAAKEITSRSSRPGSSRAASSPPTPASRSPMPSSRPRPWSMNEHAHGYFTTKFRADDQGRFAMNPIAGESYTLGAFPTGGEPYLIQQDEFAVDQGGGQGDHDIKLRRGVLIRGKVTEAGTGRPLAGSSIQFIPVRGNETVLSGWQAIVASQDDGSFQIAVPPGKGHLLVFGPTGDYVLERDRLQHGSTRSARRRRATTPTPSSPTRSRPATRRTRSPRRCGPA